MSLSKGLQPRGVTPHDSPNPDLRTEKNLSAPSEPMNLRETTTVEIHVRTKLRIPGCVCKRAFRDSHYEKFHTSYWTSLPTLFTRYIRSLLYL